MMFKIFLLLTCLFGLTACRNLPPLPPADLAAPGWTSYQGQAIWRRNERAPEIAGELLLATRADGSALVQFSKNPFPLMSAQRTPDSWEVQLPTQNRRYSGKGAPPTRLFWLYLPDALRGAPPPAGWAWRAAGTTNQNWRLENRRTGEFLEGFLVQ